TEIPKDLGPLRRDGNVFTARVQNGQFTVDMLPPGNYLAVLMARGREAASAPVLAAVGQPATVSIAAGKKTAAADGSSPPGPRRGNSGGRGNRNAPRGGSRSGRSRNSNPAGTAPPRGGG